MTEQLLPVKVVTAYAKQLYAKPEQKEEEFTSYCVVLEDTAQRRGEIFIGQSEFLAISLCLDNKAKQHTPDRPQTYETMLNFLSVAGGVIEQCYLNDLRDETFYALVRLRVGAQVHEVDTRPSDAVNLAMRVECPIYVRASVFEAMLKGSASQGSASAA